MIDSADPAWSPRVRQPIFNLPRVVAGLAGVLVAIHVLRVLLPDATDRWVVYAFAFIPLRETASGAIPLLPGGSGAKVWTFLTYAFLHADWLHLLINGVWLAAFGSVLARRLGALRFLLFSAVGAIAGAAAHVAVHPQSIAPMVGASAAISAHMAGASRFVFAAAGPLWGTGGVGRHRQPAPPLIEVVRNYRVLVFLGVWFAVNLIFGLGGASTGLASGAVAWDAHIGGFLAGLLLFPLFDPVGSANR